MKLPHILRDTADKSPPRWGPNCRAPAEIRQAIDRLLFNEWADEAEDELAREHIARLARLLAQEAKDRLSIFRVTISRDSLYLGDYRRARRSVVSDKAIDPARLSDFYLPAVALLDRMQRDYEGRLAT